MQFTKKLTALSLCILMLITSMVIASTSKANAKAVSVSVNACETLTLRLTKTTAQQSYTFKCSTSNNSKNIKASLVNNKTTCTIFIDGLKATTDTNPIVTVYYFNKSNVKKIVSTYLVTVNKFVEPSFKNTYINRHTTKNIVLNNRYTNSYYLKSSNTKIVKIKASSISTNQNTFTLKAYGKGKATIKVYFSNTNKYVGKFTAYSGTYKTSVNTASISLKYNAHGSNAYMSKSHFKLNDVLANKKAKRYASYKATSTNDKVVQTLSSGIVYATGKGSAKVNVYEVISKKSQKIGTISIKVTKSKMSYVITENLAYYPQGIFAQGTGSIDLNLTTSKTYNLQPTIMSTLINNDITGSHFKAKFYKITYSTANTKVATVTKAGVLKAKKLGNTTLSITITFTDKSKNTLKFPVAVAVDDI